MSIFIPPKGTNEELSNIVLKEGEIVFNTTNKKFYTGDDLTSGGIPIVPSALDLSEFATKNEIANLISSELDPKFAAVSGDFASKEDLNQKQDAITEDNKLSYDLLSGLTSISIDNEEAYNKFKVEDSNITLGTTNTISPTPAGNILQVNIGLQNETSGLLAYAHGKKAKALARYAVSDGYETIASGEVSHAFGMTTVAGGSYSVSQGRQTKATANYSHAEGWGSESRGEHAHAEGEYTAAIGGSSHSEGDRSHARGYGSHVEGQGSVADGAYQHVEGKYNYIPNNVSDYQHIVGNGPDADHRRNMQTLDWNGNEWNAGSVTAMSGFFEGDKKLATLEYVQALEARIAALENLLNNNN